MALSYCGRRNYPGPYDFINVQLSGQNIPAVGNQNLSHFDDAAFNRRMDAAAIFSGSRRTPDTPGSTPSSRARDADDSVRQRVPERLVSSRLGCIVLAPASGGLDFAAACLKE